MRAKSMEKGSTFGQTAAFMREAGSTTKSQGSGSMCGQMAGSTKANG